MLDIAYIRENAEVVKKAARDKCVNTDIDRLLQLDAQIKRLTGEVDGLRAQRNQLTAKIKNAPNAAEREQWTEQVRQLKELLPPLEQKQTWLRNEYDEIMLTVPSVPAPEVPVGNGEQDNVEVRCWGEIPRFDFEFKNHVQLAESLDLVDIPRGVKVAGSRSYFLKNQGMLLEMAVCRFAIDVLRGKGFTPMAVPVMVKQAAMTGTGYFPSGREQSYKLPEDDRFLVGTSEVSLVAYHSGETLDKQQLPKKYAGHSYCFRREAGTYGKDTRGLYRVHQFQKVEQVIICEADDDVARRYHQEILANTEEILQALRLPYRVMLACTGEIGVGQIRKHEVETWMPSRNAYCETHSCSTMGDFQARRCNIKYRDDGVTKFCYTLNNTGIASPRILIPLLEVHQRPDGRVNVPEPLIPYMGGVEIIDKVL